MSSDATRIIVELNEDVFAALGLDQLEESRWVPSHHRGYSMRVDPARPEMRQQRHVHIAHDKHVSAKQKQVSWNQDRTRHDKKSFDTGFKSMAIAKDIARSALDLPSDAILESMRVRDRLTLLIETVLDEGMDAPDLTEAIHLRLDDGSL